MRSNFTARLHPGKRAGKQSVPDASAEAALSNGGPSSTCSASLRSTSGFESNGAFITDQKIENNAGLTGETINSDAEPPQEAASSHEGKTATAHETKGRGRGGKAKDKEAATKHAHAATPIDRPRRQPVRAAMQAAKGAISNLLEKSKRCAVKTAPPPARTGPRPRTCSVKENKATEATDSKEATNLKDKGKRRAIDHASPAKHTGPRTRDAADRKPETEGKARNKGKGTAVSTPLPDSSTAAVGSKRTRDCDDIEEDDGIIPETSDPGPSHRPTRRTRRKLVEPESLAALSSPSKPPPTPGPALLEAQAGAGWIRELRSRRVSTKIPTKAPRRRRTQEAAAPEPAPVEDASFLPAPVESAEMELVPQEAAQEPASQDATPEPTPRQTAVLEPEPMFIPVEPTVLILKPAMWETDVSEPPVEVTTPEPVPLEDFPSEPEFAEAASLEQVLHETAQEQESEEAADPEPALEEDSVPGPVSREILNPDPAPEEVITEELVPLENAAPETAQEEGIVPELAPEEAVTLEDATPSPVPQDIVVPEHGPSEAAILESAPQGTAVSPETKTATAMQPGPGLKRKRRVADEGRVRPRKRQKIAHYPEDADAESPFMRPSRLMMIDGLDESFDGMTLEDGFHLDI